MRWGGVYVHNIEVMIDCEDVGSWNGVWLGLGMGCVRGEMRMKGEGRWLWWRIEQFHSLINISSQSNHTSSFWWSVSNSHSYSTRNNHCHKQPHSKSHKKGKREKDMEVWWMIVIVCGSVVQLGICDDFGKVWKHIGRQKQGIDGDGRGKWCDTDRNDVKIRVVCVIYD